MRYTEVLPDDILSHHIECYWHMSLVSVSQESPFELLLPTCTFNIIFTDHPCYIKTTSASEWVHFLPGGAFFGQRNNSIHIKAHTSFKLYGVRFKPFAFANLINIPIYKLNDAFTPLDKLFDLNTSNINLIDQISKTKETHHKIHQMNDLMYSLLKKSWSVDERLRAQLNYILDRRGSVRVGEVLEEFKVSKVTLRKHFIHKVGLTPKKVSQIWRMNHMLQMKADNPSDKLTTLCLKAGFYDQAHFIKDFKSLFGIPPRKFFVENSHLVQLAHHNISRRFTNQYDPK